MGNQFIHSADSSGFQYEKNNNFFRDNKYSNDSGVKNRDKDDDLIIEENTVYEIDRECYEKMKKQRRRKS